MGINLYDLTGDYIKVLHMAEDGDIDQQMANDMIEGIGGEIEIKAEGYGIVCQALDNDVTELKAEIDRLTQRKKSIEGNRDRLKKSLEQAMIATGKTKFKTKLFSFSIAKTPSAVKFTDDFNINDIQAEYLTFADPTVNKKAVKEAIENGQAFDWAYLETGESLRIR